jgi:hypothetical protein
VDPGIIVGGFLVGICVGLTGMGGGALMTPLLVLGFGVDPLAAVSSDIVASLVMKPIGGTVHARRGTVHRGIVLWLSFGSVPAAFAGVILLRALGDGEELGVLIEQLLGVTLLVAAAAMTVRLVMRAGGSAPETPAAVPVRRAATLAVGVVGGLAVGVTSVGAGSLMIVLLLWLYPVMSSKSLVGTDLVQAVPLIAAASLGHALYGDVQLGLTAALLLGCIPGVYLGARVSSRANDDVIRPLIVAVLASSALRLLGLPATAALGAGVAAGVVVVGVERRVRRGMPRDVDPAPTLPSTRWATTPAED